MDKEEIIRRLKKISEHAVHVVGEPPLILSLDDGIALNEAVRLLKEQEELNDHYQSLLIAYNDMRKEQEPKPIAYTDNPYTGLPVARCPKCGKFARQFHSAIKEETHYCPWCGQAVKWE